MKKIKPISISTKPIIRFPVLVIAILLSFTSALAVADYRCHSDNYGNTTCRDDGGNNWRGYSDNYGNSTWRDNNGNTVRCHTDSYGNTTCRD